MIVREYKVNYVCSNRRCKSPQSLSVPSPNKSRDITGIWMEIDKKRICHNCSWPMEVRDVICKVSVDIFGSNMHGEWICNNHPYISFFPFQLRNAYYRDSTVMHSYYVYREVVKMGFPWKCPTCKEPMRYVDERDVQIVDKQNT